MSNGFAAGNGVRRSAPRALQWLVCIVVCGLVAACGGPGPTPTPDGPGLEAEVFFYDWAEDVPQEVLDAFSQEYWVKVNYVTYETSAEAAASVRAGAPYDVAVIETRFLPDLIQEGHLTAIPRQQVPNVQNIAPSFRDLVYDQGNRYSVPFNWGTTALVVRSDLVAEPVQRWADLWAEQGKVGIWGGEMRDVIGMALKSLGYSVNSEDRDELEAALARLIEIKPRLVDMDDYEDLSSAPLLEKGRVEAAVGYAYDALTGREANPAIVYVLPEEGALLWGDHFVIPASSPHPMAAAALLNYLLRPEVAAQISNANLYATANEAAMPFIDAALRDDPVVFPPNDDLARAELVLPLSPEGEALYAEIWQRFLEAN